VALNTGEETDLPQAKQQVRIVAEGGFDDADALVRVEAGNYVR
jgi:hypothetical protein